METSSGRIKLSMKTVILSTLVAGLPGCGDKNVQPILDSTEVYPAVMAAHLLTSTPTTRLGTGVACGLNNIQKIADGDTWAAAPRAEDDFDAVEDDEDDLLG